jgi:hypothetical protein
MQDAMLDAMEAAREDAREDAMVAAIVAAIVAATLAVTELGARNRSASRALVLSRTGDPAWLQAVHLSHFYISDHHGAGRALRRSLAVVHDSIRSDSRGTLWEGH